MAHHLADMVHRERALEGAGADAGAGGVGHLPLLNMETRRRVTIQPPGMVEMHVADDDRVDGRGVDPEIRQRLNRVAQDGGAAPFRLFPVEAGVHKDCPVTVLQYPDEEIDRRVFSRMIVKEKIFHPQADSLFGVFQRVDFPVLAHVGPPSSPPR